MVLRSNCRAGSLPRAVALWPPSWVTDIFGVKGRVAQLTAMKVGGEGDRGALVADPFGADREGRAVGRVDHEVGLVDVDLDLAHPDRDAADDLGHRFGVGDHVGVEGVDVEGDADDDGAVVIGAGEGRGDRDQAEGRALEGPGQVDLADGVEGVGAGAGGDVGGADFSSRPGSSGRPARLRPGCWPPRRSSASGQ